jgi:hypothetical protein
MPSQPIRMPFPFGGLTTNLGYETGESQTTRGCLNIVPDSSEESRTRGGTRPGVSKRYQTSVGEPPTFCIRVSGGDNTRVYEYLVVGTTQNIHIGQSQSIGTTYPIRYSEVLGPISGGLETEDGNPIVTENANSGATGPNYNLVIYDFNVEGSANGLVTNYRDVVIIDSDGQSVSGAVTSGFSGRTGSVTYSSGLKLSDAGITDWTAEELDTDSLYVEITTTQGTVVNTGTYRIGASSTGDITLVGDSPISTGSSTDTVTYSIKNAVRSLNPNTPSLSVLVPTGGYVPLNSDYVVSYRDRLVWAKNRTWYMSKQGDAGNYDYGADPEDPSRAIAGVNSGPGEPADPIISMATAGYDYLIFFSEAAVWVMRGDPAYGGQLYQASSVAGCVGKNAWCYGDSTEIYFLGKDGLYLMEPNAGQIRQLSQGKLPRTMRGLDRDNFDISLVYDPEDNGVILFIVPKDFTQGTHYYYDIATQSFWPFSLANNAYQPKFAVTFGGAPTRSRKACIASSDGFIREWSGLTDDGLQIPSNVIMGPYQVGGPDGIDGILSEIVARTDKDSVSVDIEVYAANSAEEASQAAIDGVSPNYTFTCGAGRSQQIRPRIRGSSFCIKMVASGAWSFESMSGMIAAGGRNRRV